MKGGSNTSKNATFGYRMQKLGKVLVGRCTKIDSSMWAFTDLGGIQRVMMVIWGQWCWSPPYLSKVNIFIK